MVDQTDFGRNTLLVCSESRWAICPSVALWSYPWGGVMGFLLHVRTQVPYPLAMPIAHPNPLNTHRSPRPSHAQGTQQVCAGYCMYGQCTTMILTTGSGVNGFTLHPGIGEFILTHPKITIPGIVGRGKVERVGGSSRSKPRLNPMLSAPHSSLSPPSARKPRPSARKLAGQLRQVWLFTELATKRR